MKKIAILLLILLPISVWAQRSALTSQKLQTITTTPSHDKADETDPDPEPDPEDTISDIRVEQRTDGSGLVDITYTLTGKHADYYIDLEVSLDGGERYITVNPFYISGDVWPVSPDSNLVMTFRAKETVPEASTHKARVRLTARTGLIVTTNPPDSITWNSAILGGQVLADGGNEVSNRGVVWHTEPSPTLANSSLASGSGLGSFAEEVTDLEPLTTYYVRAYASNMEGTVYGNQVEFTTTDKDPIVMEGPGGSRFTFHANDEEHVGYVSLHEHQPLVRQGEEPASIAIQIDIEHQHIIHSGFDYMISLPVTNKEINPAFLHMNVKMEKGSVFPLPGWYDEESGYFHARTFGFANNWVVGVVSGKPPGRAMIFDKTDQPDPKSSPETMPNQDDDIRNWPTTGVSALDYSGATPRPLSSEAIANHIAPIAQKAFEALKNAGFAAPFLKREDTGHYQMILVDTVSYSYYEPPSRPLLGRIFIHYTPYMSDLQDPDTWELDNVIMHEIFHAIQWGYNFNIHSDTSHFHQDIMIASSAYLEGTASLIGGTFEKYGSISQGHVSIDEKHVHLSHDPGHPVDDFIYSSAYEKQDFFAFLAMRFFHNNLAYLDPLWYGFGLQISGKEKRGQETASHLLQFRRDLDFLLRVVGSSLPEAYTGYALQRLYFHDSRYRLRPNENPERYPEFGEKQLARNLLRRSGRHTEWTSESETSYDFPVWKTDTLRPLTSAAATLVIPARPGQQARNDTIQFSVGLSGEAKIRPEIKDESIRILIIKAKDHEGTPVDDDSFMVVKDHHKPILVPVCQETSHLIFIISNAYVNEVVTDVHITQIRENMLVHNATQNTWYEKIQHAINEAADEDVIMVYPGTYHESVSIWDKHIVLRSASGSDVTIIDGSMSGNLPGVQFMDCSGGELSGFTIQQWQGGGVRILGSNISVTHNIITKNESSSTGGLSATDSDVTIEKNLINYNSNTWGGAGVSLSYSTADIRENLISGNMALGSASGGGMMLSSGSYEVRGNIITNNKAQRWGGGLFVGTSDALVFDNTIDENKAEDWAGGIFISHCNDCTITGNRILNNAATNRGGGMLIREGNPLVSQNEINHNKAIYGGGIEVLNQNARIKSNMIHANEAVHGGGIHIFSGDNSSIISNNTITNNLATDKGGGILSWTGHPQITDNHINKNEASGRGGGIAVLKMSEPFPLISGNTIAANKATEGGGIYGNASNWERTAQVTVNNVTRTVLRHAPPFEETSNTYGVGDMRNINTALFGAWGPGSDNWVEDSGYNVRIAQ